MRGMNVLSRSFVHQVFVHVCVRVCVASGEKRKDERRVSGGERQEQWSHASKRDVAGSSHPSCKSTASFILIGQMAFPLPTSSTDIRLRTRSKLILFSDSRGEPRSTSATSPKTTIDIPYPSLRAQDTGRGDTDACESELSSEYGHTMSRAHCRQTNDISRAYVG